MIHIFIRGRLGNQLFQYAFVRNIQNINPKHEVVYHFNDVYSQGTVEDGWENSLKYFKTIDVNEAETSCSLSWVQKVILHLYWWKYPHNESIDIKNTYQMKWVKILSHFGLFYLDLGFYPFKTESRNIIISGNFECEKYFSSIKPSLLEEISPLQPPLPHNRELLSKIKDSQSVCISVRRGDFVDNPNFSALHNICTKAYFLNAIKKVTDLVQNPVFFIFSDDIEWAKSNIPIDYPCYFERGTDPVWEKLRLMYSCRHFIISNSTFSWWAQYLSRNEDKIVIAPKRWYNNPFKSALYDDKWILIDS